MKKLIFQIIFCVSILMVFSSSAYALPFTDEDYLREDFSINDYREYLEWADDDKNPKWSSSAEAIICSASPNNNAPADYSIEIPESVEIIGPYTFDKRKLPQEAFDFSKMKNLKFIDNYAFFGNSTFRIDLSQTSVVRIKTDAFYPHNCHESIFIAPKTLKRIDSRAFSYAPFFKVILNDGLEYIGDYAFADGIYNNTLIPASVKHIGYHGLDVDTRKTYRVYKGTYAEEWCKSNGVKYVYEEDVIEKIKALEGKTMKLGPLTVEGVKFCNIEEKNGIPYYYATIIHGGSITTNYDDMNLLLTSGTMGKEWDIAEGYYGLTDNFFLESSSSPVKICIADEGIIATPSEKNSDGTYTKGLKWMFSPNPAAYGSGHFIIAKRGNKEYRFHIVCINEDTKYNNSPKTATLTTSAVYINGSLSALSAYNIDGNNYFKLRDVAMALNGTPKQFNVTWNQSLGQINLISSSPYSPVGGELIPLSKKENDASKSFAQILKDGYEEVALPYNIDGNNYYKLRDIGRIFNFSIIWDGDNNRILIDTNSPYIYSK